MHSDSQYLGTPEGPEPVRYEPISLPPWRDGDEIGRWHIPESMAGQRVMHWSDMAVCFADDIELGAATSVIDRRASILRKVEWAITLVTHETGPL